MNSCECPRPAVCRKKRSTFKMQTIEFHAMCKLRASISITRKKISALVYPNRNHSLSSFVGTSVGNAVGAYVR